MTEHQEQADHLDSEAQEMEQRSERLGEEISDVRENWAQKVADDSVPGTPPAPKGDDGDQDAREPWPDE